VATALLFERHEVDEIDDWADGFPRLGRSSVLWIDLERPERAEVERLAELLEVDDAAVTALTEKRDRPQLRDHESYIEVTRARSLGW
jgi:Mg2+ and Co2+ transporter CorA